MKKIIYLLIFSIGIAFIGCVGGTEEKNSSSKHNYVGYLLSKDPLDYDSGFGYQIMTYLKDTQLKIVYKEV